MLEPEKVEELASRLAALLPTSLSGLRRELEDNFRAVLRANLERFDLVSRERFDLQATLLMRTQERLLQLEDRLKLLESGAEPAPVPVVSVRQAQQLGEGEV